MRFRLCSLDFSTALALSANDENVELSRKWIYRGTLMSEFRDDQWQGGLKAQLCHVVQNEKRLF